MRRRSKHRRLLAALIATLTVIAGSVLATTSASSAATTSPHSDHPARSAASNTKASLKPIVKKTSREHAVRVTKIISKAPDKEGKLRVQLANGKSIALPQATAKKALAHSKSQVNAASEGNGCGTDTITLGKKVSDNAPVAMQVGFNEPEPVVDYNWLAYVNGPNGWSDTYSSSGAVLIGESWTGTYNSPNDEPGGDYSAYTSPGVSTLTLLDGTVCYSSGPSVTASLPPAEADCLANVPSGSYAAGSGWVLNTITAIPQINMTTTPNGPGTRAATGEACVTSDVTGGTATNGEDITGWYDALKYASDNSLTQQIDRCHVIARQLGGHGKSNDDGLDNLVPCWHTGVNADTAAMSEDEQDVYDEATTDLGPNDAVLFIDEPVYHDYGGTPNSTIPYEFILSATIQRANGTTEMLIPTTYILNSYDSTGAYNLGN